MNNTGTLSKEVGIALVAILILAAIPLLTPSRLVTDFVIRLAAFGVFATSLNILLGSGGMVSFGHAMFFGGGAFAFGLLMQNADVSIGSEERHVGKECVSTCVYRSSTDH